MQFLRVFHWSMYAQVFVASGLLAAAEGGLAPSLLTFIIGAVALIFNDRRGAIGLSDWWANGLALLAFAVGAYEFMGDSQEAKLLAGSHLIVYLLWIVLLWKREMRHFWWISALCLLHVALSAVLTQASWFGMALVGYVVFLVWNLTLFTLYRAEEEVRSAPTVFESEKGAALLAQPIGAISGHSQVRGNVQNDSGGSRIDMRLVGGSLMTTMLGIMIGSIIFVLTPRIWMKTPDNIAQRRMTDLSSGRSVTGFTEKVRLGDIGEILESSDPVLSLRAFDNKTGRQLDVMELAEAYGMNEPYLRGSVLVRYEQGTWHPSANRLSERETSSITSSDYFDAVRQEIVLEPIGSDLLFAMRPYSFQNKVFGSVVGAAGGMTVRFPAYTLARKDGSRRVQYQVLSWPAWRKNGTLRDLRPYRMIRSRRGRAELVEPPGGRLKRLDALAKRIAEGAQKEGMNRDQKSLAVARALESYLRDSGEFRYSLNASVTDPHVDPLEDFLFNRREGHCEYYAAALTLMLRSAGIPSRLVNGFKGGEYDAEKKVLQVEQRHAHSWVEAAIGDQWLTMDPTPPAERQQVIASYKAGPWKSFTRGFWRFWNENVVTVTLSRQERELFQPMMAYLKKAFSSTEGMRAALGDLWQWIKNTISSPRKWISIDGGLLVFLFLGIPTILFYLVRRLVRRLRDRWKQSRQMLRRSRRTVEFYERFKRLAKKLGYAPAASQTQREFAESLQEAVSDRGETGETALDLGGTIADSFYRVRFGEEELDNFEVKRIEREIQSLERLAGGRK